MKHLKHISTPRKADSHGGNDGIFAKIDDLIGGLLPDKDE